MRLPGMMWIAVLALFVACGEGEKMVALDVTGSTDLGTDSGGETPVDVVEGDNQKPQEDTVIPEDNTVTPDNVVPDGVDPDVCVPDCEGKNCGSDGCGGTCGECINDCNPTCDPEFVPFDDPGMCHDGQCAVICCPNCCGQECGPDGCGGICGVCDEGWICQEGECILEGCEPDCAGLECGDDGCGGSCGVCSADEGCLDGVCIGVWDECDELCAEVECGMVLDSSGLDCDCGTCPPNQICQNNQCKTICQPDCANKNCGSDGCGGLCGACGSSEECIDGVCVGYCNVYDLDFPDDEPVQKVVSLAVGNGQPGGGLNIDDNASTCAPSGSCSGGVDNALSGLMSTLESFIAVQDELDAIVESGDLILVALLDGMSSNGTPFDLNFYMGEPVSASCNVQTQHCHYWVDAMSIDPETCLPYIRFDNAAITGGVLTAGGANYKFEIMLPMDSITLPLILRRAHVYAEVSGSAEGMTLSNGILAGAIPKEELIAAVENLPPDVVAELPVSLDMVINLLNMMLETDIDTDGDGVLDSVSAGFLFSMQAAYLDGVQ